MAIRQVLANTVDRLSTALRLPEYGRSESINNNLPTVNTGRTVSSQAAGYVPYTPAYYSPNVPTNVYAGSTRTSQYQAPASTGQVLGTATPQKFTQNVPQNPNQGQPNDGQNYDQAYMDQINSLYGDSENFLNQQEQALRGGEQDFYKQYAGQYEAQLPLLGQARDTGLAGVQSERNRVGTEELNALAAARSLYNELTQGSRQRFGGAGSAAMASSEILGRELQRNMGGVQNTAGQNRMELGNRENSLNTEYQAKVQSLESQKQAALAQARLDFQDKLNQINQNRLAIGQSKAEAKLGALQELRARMNGIQDEVRQYTMGLESARQQALMNMKAATGDIQGLANMPLNLQAIQAGGYSSITPNQQSQSSNISGFLSPQDRERYNALFAR